MALLLAPVWHTNKSSALSDPQNAFSEDICHVRNQEANSAFSRKRVAPLAHGQPKCPRFAEKIKQEVPKGVSHQTRQSKAAESLQRRCQCQKLGAQMREFSCPFQTLWPHKFRACPRIYSMSTRARIGRRVPLKPTRGRVWFDTLRYIKWRNLSPL